MKRKSPKKEKSPKIKKCSKRKKFSLLENQKAYYHFRKPSSNLARGIDWDIGITLKKVQIIQKSPKNGILHLRLFKLIPGLTSNK